MAYGTLKTRAQELLDRHCRVVETRIRGLSESSLQQSETTLCEIMFEVSACGARMIGIVRPDVLEAEKLRFKA